VPKFDRHEVNGVVFVARCIYQGTSIVRHELKKLSNKDWPKDEDLLKHFGERGFGGQVKHAGRTSMVEIYID
jgi:hypothetical protein